MTDIKNYTGVPMPIKRMVTVQDLSCTETQSLPIVYQKLVMHNDKDEPVEDDQVAEVEEEIEEKIDMAQNESILASSNNQDYPQLDEETQPLPASKGYTSRGTYSGPYPGMLEPIEEQSDIFTEDEEDSQEPTSKENKRMSKRPSAKQMFQDMIDQLLDEEIKMYEQAAEQKRASSDDAASLTDNESLSSQSESISVENTRSSGGSRQGDHEWQFSQSLPNKNASDGAKSQDMLADIYKELASTTKYSLPHNPRVDTTPTSGTLPFTNESTLFSTQNNTQTNTPASRSTSQTSSTSSSSTHTNGDALDLTLKHAKPDEALSQDVRRRQSKYEVHEPALYRTSINQDPAANDSLPIRLNHSDSGSIRSYGTHDGPPGSSLSSPFRATPSLSEASGRSSPSMHDYLELVQTRSSVRHRARNSSATQMPSWGASSQPPQTIPRDLHGYSDMSHTRSTTSLSVYSSDQGDADPSDMFKSRLSIASFSLTQDENAIKTYRRMANKTNDRNVQLTYAKYLLEVARPCKLRHRRNSAMINHTHIRLMEEAEYWIEKLAKAGHPEALYIKGTWHAAMPGENDCVGNAYQYPNPQKAFQCFKNAARVGWKPAYYEVARHWEQHGDFKKAVRYYKDAAEAGHTAAAYKMARVLLHGQLNQPKNIRHGLAYLQLAADSEEEGCAQPSFVLSCVFSDDLEMIGLDRNNVMSRKNDQLAMFYLERSAGFGLPAAVHQVGIVHESGLFEQEVDPSKALKCFTKAAEDGYAPAMLSLSRLYAEGIPGLLAAQPDAAFRWCKRAADKELEQAEFILGTYYEDGVGVEPDYASALRYFSKAASKGYDPAKERLNIPTNAPHSGVSKPSFSARMLAEGRADSNAENAMCIVM